MEEGALRQRVIALQTRVMRLFLSREKTSGGRPRQSQLLLRRASKPGARIRAYRSQPPAESQEEQM